MINYQIIRLRSKNLSILEKNPIAAVIMFRIEIANRYARHACAVCNFVTVTGHSITFLRRL